MKKLLNYSETHTIKILSFNEHQVKRSDDPNIAKFEKSMYLSATYNFMFVNSLVNN